MIWIYLQYVARRQEDDRGGVCRGSVHIFRGCRISGRRLPEQADPGHLNYGSGGSGTSLHLAGELFKITAGVDLVHVPYKGASVAMNDVIGGRLDSLFIGIPAPAPHVKAGRLRGLAVLAPRRSSVLPEVPTATEAGLPGFEVTTWYGVLVPAATPKDIVARLNREIVKIMNAPETKERLAVVAAEPMTSTPEEFSAHIKQEIAKWAKVVRTAGFGRIEHRLYLSHPTTNKFAAKQ